ncbi:dienelactone hydrolase [Polaromonas sp.]|uniref:alpha/beta hydrolase family protein n=1 Tax=Polaromonas sp. TaxID=1869339 RepID=UPI0024885F60|nr:dienelactone hydrolase [Polaromonas sp.]MDI1274882.1 dienelactone hydrolase [Polaromonas sp.]
MQHLKQLLIAALTTCLLAHTSICHAQAPNMGFMQLPQQDGGHTTIFYPTEAAEAPAKRGPFELRWASDAQAIKGNGRLIVISHGSGGSPWVHTDLARVLVQRGFVVAIPQHHGDNYLDPSDPGPASWVKRPPEISRAIDAVADSARLAGLLSLDSVGVFGGSAGGHTALTLAGGQWSFARFRDHCERNIERDFSSCVGFKTLLQGDWLDGPKLWLAKRLIAWRFPDEAVQRYTDSRIKAAVAMVPFAADFIPESLANPRIPLGLVIAAKDVNQIPAFHVEAIRRSCEPRCEVIMNLAEGSHGAMLSPMPPWEPGSIAARLLSDPGSFNRSASLPALHGQVADFFSRTLKVGQ